MIRGLSTAMAALLLPCLAGCRSLYRVANGGNYKPWQMASPVTYLGLGADGRQVPCGVIEFDDQGQLWRDANNKTQLPRVLDALEAAKSKGPVQLILYVHGWNNNANPDLRLEKNLMKFQQSLQAVDRTLKGTGMSAFGVFVSWRGQTQSFTFPLDYFDRESSAMKVGRVEATAALQALCTKARHNSPRSRVLAVGHSLGGVILLRAVAQPLAERVAEAAMKNSKFQRARVQRAMADTVVIVNTADNSILARQLVAVLTDFSVKNEDHGIELPMLVSVTADSDFASGRVYTLASGLGRYALSPLMTQAGGRTVNADQEKATITSVGHFKSIHSHTLRTENPNEHDHGVPPKVITGNDPVLARKKIEALILANLKPKDPNHRDELLVWLDPETSKPGERNLVPHSLKRIDSATNKTPYWIFQCGSYVAKGHSDIWNANFTGLLTALQYASVREDSGRAGPAAKRRIENKRRPESPPEAQTSARLLQ